MPSSVDRRTFLRRAVMAAGWGLAVPLAAACAPAATSPTAAPSKPAEAAKPAEPPKPAEAAKPAAPAAPASITKVSYGIVTFAPFHVTAIVGVEKPEFMAKHGVELDLVITGSSPATVQAIVGGSMNVAGATSESAWAAQDQTPSLLQIGAIAQGYPYSLLVNPDIKAIAELRGKPLGATAVRAGADTTALRAMLFENGLKDGDFDIVPVGSIAERAAALKAGTIAGAVQIEPQTSLLIDQGFVELDNADNYPKFRDLQTIMLLSKKDWYEPNMATAVAFMKGWVDVNKWVYDPKNRDEVVALMAKRMNVDTKYSNNAYERHFVKSKTLPLDPKVDVAAIGKMAELQKTIGGLEKVPTEFAKYADNTIVEKAMA